MPVRRIIAAKGDSASLAGAQMQPPAVHFDAFFADIGLGGLNIGDRIQVLA